MRCQPQSKSDCAKELEWYSACVAKLRCEDQRAERVSPTEGKHLLTNQIQVYAVVENDVKRSHTAMFQTN